ncbi:MAG: hypothetical protein M3133_02570, partial [Actinomycetota bacterium]|nr:hypothetical protein [Actinomycetota bacterium]
MAKRFESLRHELEQRRRSFCEGIMYLEALRCKECGERYAAEARFACDTCFGPLEATYGFSSLDPETTRRRIQAG